MTLVKSKEEKFLDREIEAFAGTEKETIECGDFEAYCKYHALVKRLYKMRETIKEVTRWMNMDWDAFAAELQERGLI
jgi:saccharopine dehydrogenase-like NADP-dependent oxidoreductase